MKKRGDPGRSSFATLSVGINVAASQSSVGFSWFCFIDLRMQVVCFFVGLRRDSADVWRLHGKDNAVSISNGVDIISIIELHVFAMRDFIFSFFTTPNPAP